MTRQTASIEDYLEAIVLLAEKGESVTVTAISKALGVTKPSVTFALTKLSEAGLVKHEKYGDVILTSDGAGIAQDVYKRHKVLRSLLIDVLDVNPKVAEEDACRMEHSLSATSLERLAKFVEFVLTCPRGEPEWLKGFNYYFEHGERNPKLLETCHDRDD